MGGPSTAPQPCAHRDCPLSVMAQVQSRAKSSPAVSSRPMGQISTLAPEFLPQCCGTFWGYVICQVLRALGRETTGLLPLTYASAAGSQGHSGVLGGPSLAARVPGLGCSRCIAATPVSVVLPWPHGPCLGERYEPVLPGDPVLAAELLGPSQQRQKSGPRAPPKGHLSPFEVGIVQWWLGLGPEPSLAPSTRPSHAGIPGVQPRLSFYWTEL